MGRLESQAIAADLVRGMLAQDPRRRPSAAAVLTHPLWWPSAQRLAFLIDVSDRVEGEDRVVSCDCYQRMGPASPVRVCSPGLRLGVMLLVGIWMGGAPG